MLGAEVTESVCALAMIGGKPPMCPGNDPRTLDAVAGEVQRCDEGAARTEVAPNHDGLYGAHVSILSPAAVSALVRTIPLVGSRRRDRYTAPEDVRYSLSPEAINGPVEGAGLRPVHAWVPRNDGTQHRFDAVAVSSTPDAVCVRWLVDGQLFQAWVWRTGVKHRKLAAAVDAT